MTKEQARDTVGVMSGWFKEISVLVFVTGIFDRIFVKTDPLLLQLWRLCAFVGVSCILLGVAVWLRIKETKLK